MNRCLGCMEKIDKHETVCPHCGYTAGAGASEHSHLTPGTLLRDRYLIGRVLGHGGFGVTYIGYDTALERKLAIKEYLPGELATRFPGQTNVSVFDGERRVQYEIGLERFVKEAQNLAQFAGQEGIVRIYDSFAEGNTGYIVMEYLQGQTLKQYLAAKGGKLKPDEAIQLILPVLNALKIVHATGIIHRDISPDNIFLTDDGDIKLIDFGAARFASTQHSKSLSVILKPGYAPEEQYRSRGRQGPWTDIYAVGATFYRLITGQTPEEALERTVNDTLKPPSALGVKIGTGIENALMNALNIHAEDRIQQAAEFEAALLGTIKLDRKIVRQTRPDTGHWPTWLKIVTGAASLAFVLTAALLLTGVISVLPTKKIQLDVRANDLPLVPGLINLTVQEGQQAAEQAGLNFVIVDKQVSYKVLTDKIMTQTPAEGQRVEAGTRIEVVVSAGPERIVVPSVVHRMADVAVAMLDEQGFKVLQEEVFSTDEAPGVVVTQSIEPGTPFEKGKQIRLSVSKGPELTRQNESVVMPDLAGLPFSQARQSLLSLGLYALLESESYSANIPVDHIIEQRTKAGQAIQTGDVVALKVSLGVEQTTVPDLQYKSLADAYLALRKAKLDYVLTYESSSTVKEGNIIRQDLAPDQMVAAGSLITLTVSGNKPTDRLTPSPVPTPTPYMPIPTPDGYLALYDYFDYLGGLSESEAKAEVLSKGFGYAVEHKSLSGRLPGEIDSIDYSADSVTIDGVVYIKVGVGRFKIVYGK